jgi:hypothetical protein
MAQRTLFQNHRGTDGLTHTLTGNIIQGPPVSVRLPARRDAVLLCFRYTAPQSKSGIRIVPQCLIGLWLQ